MESVLSYAHQIPHTTIDNKNINVQNIDPKTRFLSTVGLGDPVNVLGPKIYH